MKWVVFLFLPLEIISGKLVIKPLEIKQEKKTLVYSYLIPETHREKFIQKVWDISDSLSIDPDWLMTVMFIESRLNPFAVNPYTKATGLIQFMPSTCKQYYISQNDMYSLGYEQIDYVYKFFRKYRGKIKKKSDLYLLCFYPCGGKITGYPDWYKFPDYVYKVNKIFDINKDKQMYLWEVKRKVDRYGLETDRN